MMGEAQAYMCCTSCRKLPVGTSAHTGIDEHLAVKTRKQMNHSPHKTTRIIHKMRIQKRSHQRQSLSSVHLACTYFNAHHMLNQ